MSGDALNSAAAAIIGTLRDSRRRETGLGALSFFPTFWSTMKKVCYRTHTLASVGSSHHSLAFSFRTVARPAASPLNHAASTPGPWMKSPAIPNPASMSKKHTPPAPGTPW